MTGFSADWLCLRESADAAARAARLTDWLNPEPGVGQPLRVLDLASGTGANLRYLAPRLAGLQHWQLADHDAGLLQEIPSRMIAWGHDPGIRIDVEAEALRIQGPTFECRAAVAHIDLARDLDALDFGGTHLVTASALLDLVSERWLMKLARRCRDAQACTLFALSYDGRIECTPVDAFDGRIRDLINRHQLGDKGFGPALGPAAVSHATEIFGQMDYEVNGGRSDWHLGPALAQLQSQLIAGWAAAAMEMSPDEVAEISGWRDRRLAHIAPGRSRLVVGHQDFAARPLNRAFTVL